MNGKMVTKKAIAAKAISYQLIGYGILLFLIVGDEVFDFPHTIFGFPSTPINWVESLIEGVYVISLCAFTVYLLVRLLKQIKFLEGFLPICSYCKKNPQRRGMDSARTLCKRSFRSPVFSQSLPGVPSETLRRIRAS